MLKDVVVKHEQETSAWFQNLRNKFCHIFEALEVDYAKMHNLTPGVFERKSWDRAQGGGGEMSIMRGNLFEKVGVNISTVYGDLNEEFRNKIPGASEDPSFFATGISIVSHMASPLIPAAHFNTRYIHTTSEWFGGGGDLTPIYPDQNEAELFHEAFRKTCDFHNPEYYPKFKKQCDEYFYLKHRKEQRGIGGIFFDYFNNNDFAKDFSYVQDVGLTFLDIYPKLIREKMGLSWTEEQKEYQMMRRGRYVEFNLLYDRGTQFGLMTDGNVEAILMSMPPIVSWK
jgi:coproporphyrinogen III oxidase